MKLEWKGARNEQVSLLTHWNQQLIKDEGSRNPMTPAELEGRMLGWVQDTAWQVRVLEWGETVVGYAVLHLQADNLEPARTKVYLCHYFLVPERRSQGIGRTALKLLMKQFPCTRWVLDVLATNPRAAQFYESLGFTAYATILEWKEVL